MPCSNSFLFLILTSTLLSSHARADIVGGDEVQKTDAIRSSTVGLFTPDPSGQGGALCTASLIGKGTALTAAHCVQPHGPKPILLFGRDLHSAETVKKPATGVKVNPAWGRHHGMGMDQGDIAIVKFGGKLPTGYKSVKLNGSDGNLRKGGATVLAGYGISDARAKTGAGILRKTAITIADPRPGKKEMILDRSHHHGACHGDSGGPAFVTVGGKSVLAGVTNRSYPAGAADSCDRQVVYTKVNAYRSWIKKAEKAPRAPRLLAKKIASRGPAMHVAARATRHRKH